jgi:transcriptional regulator with XRE-family HTH domain
MDKQKLIALNRIQAGRALRGLRRASGHSLEDLSFALNKDVGYLSRVETGKAAFKFDTLGDILSFYDLSVKEFYDRLDEFI